MAPPISFSRQFSAIFDGRSRPKGWFTALVKKSKVRALLMICYQSKFVLCQTSGTASAAVFVKEDLLFNIIQDIFTVELIAQLTRATNFNDFKNWTQVRSSVVA